jgi:two-component sensor histidine kinase
LSKSTGPSTENAQALPLSLLAVALQAAEMGVMEVNADWTLMVLDNQAHHLFALPDDAQDATHAKSVFDRVHTDDRERLRTRCSEALAASGAVSEAFRIWLPEGGTRWLQIWAQPIATPLTGHADKWLIGVVRDVTDREEREANLAALARDKALLLDELEHRVRNILQMVTSLLNLQAARSSSTETRRALSDASSRVVAIASAYRRLARTEPGSLVDVAPALSEIAKAVSMAAGSPPHIHQTVNIAPVVAPGATVMHLGLLVNELLTNAYKHAFVDRQSGMIHVSGRQAGPSLVIDITDDGVGETVPQDTGMGSLLVSAFAATIHAHLEKLPADQGTHHRITVPLPTG